MPTEKPAPAGRGWIVFWAIASGLGVSSATGSLPFALLYRFNLGLHPEIPWLALAELAFVPLLLVWLNGWGPPKAAAQARRQNLRLWRTPPDGQGRWSPDVLLLVAVIVALDALHILFANSLGGPKALPDMHEFPTTALRFSAFIMGALLSGVGEEAGFRGYMQSQLERFGLTFAIVVTSVVFTLAHLTHGWAILPEMPGIFIISVLYGLLAWRTGSILPAMFLHVFGDLADAYFITLGGHGALLFA